MNITIDGERAEGKTTVAVLLARLLISAIKELIDAPEFRPNITAPRIVQIIDIDRNDAKAFAHSIEASRPRWVVGDFEPAARVIAAARKVLAGLGVLFDRGLAPVLDSVRCSDGVVNRVEQTSRAWPAKVPQPGESYEIWLNDRGRDRFLRDGELFDFKPENVQVLPSTREVDSVP